MYAEDWSAAKVTQPLFEVTRGSEDQTLGGKLNLVVAALRTWLYFGHSSMKFRMLG